jgi:hypothetical protein
MKVKNPKHFFILWAIVVTFDEFLKKQFAKNILNKNFLIDFFFPIFFEKCQNFITKENHWYYGLFFTLKMLNAYSKTLLNLEANSTHTPYLGL